MKKLLVVVDYQNDFVDGSLGFPEAKYLLPYIVDKIRTYEEEGHTVVFTKDTHQGDYLHTVEGRHLPIEHCIKGSNGSDFYKEVATLSEKHLIFEKPTFGSSALFDFVRQNPFDEICLLGLVSHICVLTNAILVKTALPNAHIIVDSKGSGSVNIDMQNKGYDILKNLHIDVL